MKIGILGGTFDPIHWGHISIARQARDQFELDKVYFVPAFIPPHKEEEQVKATAQDRFEMVKRAVDQEQGFEVSDIEFKRKKPSYTVDTLRSFKEEFPGDPLFLIMGADSLPQIPTWREPEEIRNLADFLVAPRPEFPIETHDDPRIHLLKLKEMSVSASEVRKTDPQDDKKLSEMVPSQVLDYMREHKLYGIGVS